jgi:hypothetical protein
MMLQSMFGRSPAQPSPRLVAVVRVAVLTLFAIQLFVMITQVRPELLNPTAIGTDASNYFAAGQRLNAGHPLYALSPGDREVPLNPPYWSVPLLSPPFLAVVWRPLAALGEAAMVGWWLAGLGTVIVLTAWLILRGSPIRNALLALLFPALAMAAWSGNVHIAFLAVMRDTATVGATALSVPGFLHNWGAPDALVNASTLLVIVTGVAATYLLRRRPATSFLAILVTVLYGSPVIMLANFAILLAAFVPFPRRVPVLSPVSAPPPLADTRPLPAS